jgi:hypothetical protein
MHRKGLVAAAAAAICALAVVPAGASAKTTWLCRPGLANNPCVGDFTTLRVSNTNAVLGIDHPAPAAKPKVDCFYVYPTISDQQTLNANLNIDPVERSSALFEAARYSQYCRVFAPMYPELTVHGLLTSPLSTQVAAFKVAYKGVRSAWRDYLAHDNHGRGVILIGHSQGAMMLMRLIRGEIDKHAGVRRKLVSAVLLGANVVVRKGKDVGGDFQHVPACRKQRQVGCAIAYSTFDAPVPANPVFGQAGSATAALSASPTGSRYRVLCTNPASLRGGSADISPLASTTPYAPGAIATALASMGLPTPPTTTPWIEQVKGYRARCSSSHGANVLQVKALGTAVTPKPTLSPQWGLHFLDEEIALRNLLDDARGQIAAYTARRG